MTTLTMVAIAAALAVPVSGYHIDGTVSVNPTLTSADWFVSTNIFIVCESEGPTDDRNSYPFGPKAGEFGLCTTGRNDATGLSVPNVGGVPMKPAAHDWTVIDACSETTLIRNGLIPGPHPPGVAAPCAPVGVTNTIGWTAELGIMFCTVAPTEALLYNEWYAWMTYDGNGNYFHPGNGGVGAFARDLAGVAHSGDGDLLGTVPIVAPAPPFSNIADAWDGHVAMFIDTATTTDTAGSAETSLPVGINVDDVRNQCDGGGIVCNSPNVDTTVPPDGVPDECDGTTAKSPLIRGTRVDDPTTPAYNEIDF